MNWLNTATSTSTDDFQYGYDRDGNVLYKNNLLNSSFSELYHSNSATTGDNNTAYDPLNRLTGFSRGTLSSSGNNGTGLDTVTTPNTITGSTQSFSLDAVGNQTSTTTDGTTVSKTQNSKNELTGVGSSTLTYDNNGNTITDASGNTLTYDAWNRMVGDSAGSTSYTFDANGRRITETHGSTTTDLYFSSQGQVIEERVAGTVTAQNVFSIDYVNDLLLRDDNSVSGNLGITGSGLGNRVYYQHDANYNVTTTIDNGGNVINRYVYTPYGVQTVLTPAWASSSASSSIYGYQGGRFDVATGLNRFGARDYDPDTGIWREPDPKIYVNGSNLYQFEASSSIENLDPHGTCVDGCPGFEITNGPMDMPDKPDDYPSLFNGLRDSLIEGAKDLVEEAVPHIKALDALLKLAQKTVDASDLQIWFVAFVVPCVCPDPSQPGDLAWKKILSHSFMSPGVGPAKNNDSSFVKLGVDPEDWEKSMQTATRLWSENFNAWVDQEFPNCKDIKNYHLNGNGTIVGGKHPDEK